MILLDLRMHWAGVDHFLINRCYWKNLLAKNGPCAQNLKGMKTSIKILMSILAAMICTSAFAAEKPNCKKTGKNCPMNNNKECNCGKSCDCGK
jgi:hypothetical protein